MMNISAVAESRDHVIGDSYRARDLVAGPKKVGDWAMNLVSKDGQQVIVYSDQAKELGRS